MKFRTSLLGLVIISGLQACATYEQPSYETPHAIAKFKRGAGEGGNILTQGRLVSYYIATNNTCSEAPRVAFFGTGDLSGDEKSVRISTGDTIKMLAFIEVNTAGSEGGIYQRTGQSRCVAEAEFVPSSGAVYDVVLSYDGNTCALDVKDGGTAVSVEGLKQTDDVCSSKPNAIPDYTDLFR